MEWLKRQGPWSPGLIDYLKRHHQQYEALIFFTYLYAPTVIGLQVDPAKSILIPTAHDEPPIHLGIYKDVFRLPRAIGYLTEPERKFVAQTFDRGAVIEETVGCGVEIPPHHAYPRSSSQPDGGVEASQEADTAPIENEQAAGAFRPTFHPAVRAFEGGTGFTARSPSTVAGSIQAKVVRS
jgi:hypothetical protein